MKSKILKISIPLACSAMMLASCGSGSVSGKSENGEIDNFEVSQTIKSLEKQYVCEGPDAVFADSLKIYSSVKIVVEWPQKLGDYNIKTLQDSLLAGIFNKPATTIDSSMMQSANQPEGADIFKVVPIDSIPNEPCMIYTRNVMASTVAFNSDFISYRISTSQYTGGAHSMSESHYVNFDLNENKVLDLSNTFKQNSDSTLLQAIKDNLMTQFNVSSMEGLAESGIFTDQIFLTKNFYIEGTDIVFHYNPYDIAPFSSGAIDVDVPYYQIREILAPSVLKIFDESNI